MRALWITVAVLAVAAPAAGQSVRKREVGVFGGGESMDTSEVDHCEQPEGLSEEQIDARVEEHYDRGRNLYRQGDFEGAIREFVAAYCHGFYPSILVDIGQAYERLVDYEKTVAYFERYITDAPPDQASTRDIIAYRASVLRNQPSRVRVATQPPGAQVTLVGPTGIAAEGTANEDEPIELRRGDYEMRIELPGYEPIKQSIHVAIGQPYSYYFRLEPQTGQVRVVAAPSRARIFIDDKLVGLGTYVDQLPIGKHQVAVEADGRLPETRTFEVFADRPTDVRVQLADKPRSGRLELIVASTIGGGVFGGVAFDTIFGEGTTGASIGGLVGLGVGFGGGYLGVDDDIPVGTSSYLIGSTLIGATEGWLLAAWICDDDGATCGDDTRNASAIVAGVAGLGLAATTADRLDVSAGDMALVNSGAIWGSVAGALFWQVFDGDDRLGEPLTLLGLNLGVAAGITAASNTEYSRGHVALIDVAGLAGIVAGVAAANAVEQGNDSSERLEHFALGGMTLGLLGGAYLTRNRDEPKALKKVQPVVTTTLDTTGAPVRLLGVGMVY